MLAAGLAGCATQISNLKLNQITVTDKTLFSVDIKTPHISTPIDVTVNGKKAGSLYELVKPGNFVITWDNRLIFEYPDKRKVTLTYLNGQLGLIKVAQSPDENLLHVYYEDRDSASLYNLIEFDVTSGKIYRYTLPAGNLYYAPLIPEIIIRRK